MTQIIWNSHKNIIEFENWAEWFCRYSIVLLEEIDSFNGIINLITSKEILQTRYLKESVFYFGCVLGVSWFLDGISWGYSSLLTHKELDEESWCSIKVLFNFMVWLWRYFTF